MELTWVLSRFNLGYAFVKDVDLESEHSKIMKAVGMRATGGGCLTLGLFLFSPAWLRQFWLLELPTKEYWERFK